MTEFVEGCVYEIKNWTDGKGADVVLHDDDGKYYYEGGMKVPVGRACKFEVKDGEGENSGKQLILSCNELQTNPKMPPLPEPPPGNDQQPVPPQLQMVQMGYPQFKDLMDKRSSLDRSRLVALEAAVKVYDAMGKLEKDHKAAASEVIEIAKQLEGYLL